MINYTIDEYYKLNTILVMEFGMALSDLDDMMPFERELYVHLIKKRLEEKKNKQNAT